MITCKDCFQALHRYLDRELSDDDIVQVRTHLDACRGCLHAFEFEASLRRLVRVKCQQEHAPEELRQRILQRLAQEAARSRGVRGRGLPG